MDEAGVRDDLFRRFAEACAAAGDPAALAAAAEDLEAQVAGAGVPDGLRAEVLEAYHRLGSDACVAVRSSATAEDTAGLSFAGMHETFTNVVGDAGAASSRSSTAGRRSTASGSSPTAPARGLTEEPSIAVVVQEHGRRRPGRGALHRRPVDRRTEPDRDRGRLRAGRGRGRRPGRARHLRARQGRAPPDQHPDRPQGPLVRGRRRWRERTRGGHRRGGPPPRAERRRGRGRGPPRHRGRGALRRRAPGRRSGPTRTAPSTCCRPAPSPASTAPRSPQRRADRGRCRCAERDGAPPGPRGLARRRLGHGPCPALAGGGRPAADR